MVALIPVVIALVSAVKMITSKIKLLKKNEDIIAVVSSIFFGIFLSYNNPIADSNNLLQGLIIGLSASGLFSQGKTVINKITK